MERDPDAFADDIIARYGRHISSSMARLYRFMGLATVEWGGQGAVCTDVHGREYLDFNGCNGTLFHGRRHPRVIAAVREQLDRLTITSRLFAHQPGVELATLLAEVSPGDLQYSFFCNSGAEAVEGAMKLARVYTGRPEIIAAQNAFHGKTFGALSATARELFRAPFEPLLPGVRHVPYGDAGALEAAITDRTAAVLLEPVQGEGGVIVPPGDYLPAVRELCDRRGVLLILDEVQAGLGRTGRLFCSEHWGLAPDIVTLGKILGGGVMPVGAFMARADVFRPFDENPYIHSSTFGGNPLASAAALAALQATLEEGLAEQAAEKGAFLRAGLEQVRRDHPDVIREVRGLGLMIGIELHREGLGGVIIADIVANGLLAIHSLANERVLRFLPPAVVTREQMDRALEIFAAAVARAEAVLADV